LRAQPQTPYLWLKQVVMVVVVVVCVVVAAAAGAVGVVVVVVSFLLSFFCVDLFVQLVTTLYL